METIELLLISFPASSTLAQRFAKTFTYQAAINAITVT
jgi:hypothetical protein